MNSTHIAQIVSNYCHHKALFKVQLNMHVVYFEICIVNLRLHRNCMKLSYRLVSLNLVCILPVGQMKMVNIINGS